MCKNLVLFFILLLGNMLILNGLSILFTKPEKCLFCYVSLENETHFCLMLFLLWKSLLICHHFLKLLRNKKGNIFRPPGRKISARNSLSLHCASVQVIWYSTCKVVYADKSLKCSCVFASPAPASSKAQSVAPHSGVYSSVLAPVSQPPTQAAAQYGSDTSTDYAQQYSQQYSQVTDAYTTVTLMPDSVFYAEKKAEIQDKNTLHSINVFFYIAMGHNPDLNHNKWISLVSLTQLSFSVWHLLFSCVVIFTQLLVAVRD